MTGHPEPVLTGAAPARARMAAVLVHGRGQDERVMLDVVRRLALADVAYILPVAAEARWYSGRYFDPIAVNQPDLVSALGAVEAAVDIALAAGLALDRIVLGGFSQGGCVVAELLARRPRPRPRPRGQAAGDGGPRRYAGAAVLTGTLMGPPGQEVTPPSQDGLPMFFGFSRHDDWIEPERAHATARAFEAAGARVTVEVYDDREHLINDRAVDGLRRLLA